jgi:hypothetical protein
MGLATVAWKAAPLVALALLPLMFPLLQRDLGRETRVDRVLEYIYTKTQPSDMLQFATFVDEPMFYYLEKRGQWDRLMLTPDKERLLIFTELDDEDIAALLDLYGLQPYVRDCHQTIYGLADGLWRYYFDVHACAFTPAADTIS